MFRENHTQWRWFSLRALSITALAFLISAFASSVVVAQSGLMRLEHDDDRNTGALYRGGFIENDPTLDVEVWTDNESGQYYEGDDIHIYFRTNSDAYVAVYNIDTDGRVNLIFPFGENDNPYIEGGRIYRIPGPDAEYDLLVDGPAGTESIQIVASHNPFPIPDWYNGSGLVADRERYEFMDYINNFYFGCRSGCPRALDNVSYVVKEWDNYYYRPVYYNPWPVWGSYGGLYVDYYWGSSIYVDGYYYGISPLYLPRLGYGHHVVTVYDSHGYCWENSVRIHGSSAIHLDNSIIRTTAGTRSRFRSVRSSAYRNPARNGYAGVKITSKNRPRSSVSKTTVRARTTVATKTRTVKTRNGTTTRAKIDKSHGVRGFNYKKNDHARVTKSSTKSGKSAVRKSKSSTSGKRLTAFKSAPERRNKARAGKSGSSSSRKITSKGRSSQSSRSVGAGRSSVRSNSGRKSGGKSTFGRHSRSSSTRGKSQARRSGSRTSGNSGGKRSVGRSKSGGSKSSGRVGRSSGRSGSSSRGASRSSGSRSGKSGRSARGSRSGGSRGKSKK